MATAWLAQVWDRLLFHRRGRRRPLTSWAGSLSALGQPRKALGHFHRSIKLHGPAAATLYYMAECHERLGLAAEP